MTKNGLKKPEKDHLRKASRRAVENQFIALVPTLARGQWIGKTNRYRKDSIKRLMRDSHNGCIVHPDLAKYIAVSAVLHAADGWSFLGRALQATANGDPDAAKHLAYYAELRGALALLAAEGVGVFDSQHFVLDSSGQCLLFPGRRRAPKLPKTTPAMLSMGTHQIAWLALEHWASLRRSSDILSSVIRAGGIPLGEWLASFGAASSVRPIGSMWLKNWGLDLKYLGHDRDARNESSYRPTRFGPTVIRPPCTSSKDIRSVWELCEPSATSGFEAMDRHLVRLSLQSAFQARYGVPHSSQQAIYARSVNVALEDLGFDGRVKQEWASFLGETNSPKLFTYAESKADHADPSHHVHVIARATLLLRMATGAAGQLLSRAGIQEDHHKFWWQSWGVERGLWATGDEPVLLADLWADASVALEEFRDWESVHCNPSDSEDRSDWRLTQSKAILALGACERILLWGLGT